MCSSIQFASTLLFCFLTLYGTEGKGIEEIRQWFTQFSQDCMKDLEISMEDIKMLDSHKMPNNTNAKCLMACVYKKAKWLNDKGMFDKEEAAQSMKQHLDETSKYELSKKVFDVCNKVNEEPVRDGEKGCERSGYLFECVIDNAYKMGLIL